MQFALKRRARGPVINITSLIDVLFLLVIFVLLSAKFEREGGVSVNLPRGASEEVPEVKTIELVIHHDGTIYLEREKVTLEQFPARLKALRAKHKDPVLHLKTDRDAPSGALVGVLDIAKQVGQTRLNFKTKR